MNRIIAIFITLLVVAILSVGVIFFFRPKSTLPVDKPKTQTTSYTSSINTTNSTVSVVTSHTAEAVQAAYRSELAKYPSDNTKLYGTSIVGDYALQVWAGDSMGGQALLKYDTSQNKWVLLSAGGGAWSTETLTALMGVPPDVAAQLLIGLSR